MEAWKTPSLFSQTSAIMASVGGPESYLIDAYMPPPMFMHSKRVRQDIKAAPKRLVWHRARSIHIAFPAPSDARGRTGLRTLGLYMRPTSCDWVP